MTTQARAKKGGEIGVNGEFYEGGKFLPNTGRPRKNCSKQSRQWSGKIEIEPYIWIKYEGELEPNERIVSIFHQFQTNYGPYGKPIWSNDEDYRQRRIVDWEFCGDDCPHGMNPPWLYQKINRSTLVKWFEEYRTAWIEGKRIIVKDIETYARVRFE